MATGEHTIRKNVNTKFCFLMQKFSEKSGPVVAKTDGFCPKNKNVCVTEIGAVCFDYHITRHMPKKWISVKQRTV